MKRLALLALLSLVWNSHAADGAADAGLQAVVELGRINGTALACGRLDVANKAKALMLLRPPKTRRHGEAYEEATTAVFNELTADRSACPDDVILSLRFEAADIKLDAAFPAQPGR